MKIRSVRMPSGNMWNLGVTITLAEFHRVWSHLILRYTKHIKSDKLPDGWERSRRGEHMPRGVVRMTANERKRK